MKKFVLVAFFLFFLSSCEDDDRPGVATLNGDWIKNREGALIDEEVVYEDYMHTPGCNKDYVSFNFGGIYRDYNYLNNGNGCEENYDLGTWEVSGNNLSVNIGLVPIVYSIDYLSNERMVLKFTEENQTYYSEFTRE